MVSYEAIVFLTRMQCNVSLCNGDSVRPSGVVKNFNVGYISLNIRGRLISVMRDWPR